MNKKKLDQYYKTFANLYGVIDSEKAYEIICFYNPSFSKEEFLKDLKCRFKQGENGYYAVIEANEPSVYLICSACFFVDEDAFNEIDSLIDEKKLDYYYFEEDTEEEYLKYSEIDYLPFHPMNDSILERISKLIRKDMKHDPIDIMLDVMCMCSMEYEINFDQILDDFFRMKLKINKTNASDVCTLIEDINSITRKWHLNGFTPEEFEFMNSFEIKGEILHITNTLKRDIINQELDYHDLLRFIDMLDVDSKNKELLKEEVLEASKKIKLH